MRNSESVVKPEVESVTTSFKPTASFQDEEVQGVAGSDSDISVTSFKRWHRRMQYEHLLARRKSFTLWRCCYKACLPCRWFDSIDYHKKICKCCLTFKTFKNIGTILIFACFFYMFMYAILKDDALPGGTFFFVLFLSVVSYLVGYCLILVGLPPMLGHLSVGLIFGNIPRKCLPERNDDLVEAYGEAGEKILLVVALVRAGLLLDLSRIQRNFLFIFLLAFVPFILEFGVVWLSSYFLLELPWDWSFLQGSVSCVVSLASLTTIFTKNRVSGYGEEKGLSMVLMAAAVMNVIFGLVLYSLSISYLIAPGSYLWTILYSILNILLGVSVGFVAGLLIAFFPDKHNVTEQDYLTEAAALRILMIGSGSFALGYFFWSFNMIEPAVLSCVTLTITAANMWEEMGWHKDNNPVQYFYTMAYYFGQPVVLSLLGFTMNFHYTTASDVGRSLAVLAIGLLFREAVCVIVTTSSLYPTTKKEKLFICIAWFSKGTYQALLAFSVKGIILRPNVRPQESYENKLKNAVIVKRSTIISILLTTPLSCFALTLLSPVLLTAPEEPKPRDRRARSNYRAYSVNY